MSEVGARYTHVPLEGDIRTLPEQQFVYMSGVGASLWNHWPRRRLKKWTRHGWKTLVRPERWGPEYNPPDWIAEMDRDEKARMARADAEFLRSMPPFPNSRPVDVYPFTVSVGTMNGFVLETGVPSATPTESADGNLSGPYAGRSGEEASGGQSD